MSIFSMLIGADRNNGGQGAYQQSSGYLNDEGRLASNYGGLAAQNAGLFGSDNATYRNSLNNYANYLQNDPNSDAQNSADRSRLLGNSGDAYQSARANIAARSAASNTMGSSNQLGATNAADLRYAGQVASANNQLAYNQEQQRQTRLQQLMGLYGGQVGQDYSRQMSAMGAQQGLDSNLASQYQNIGNAQHQAQAQYQQGIAGSLGGLAGLVGNFYGLKHGGGGLGGYGGYGGNSGYGSYGGYGGGGLGGGGGYVNYDTSGYPLED